MSVWTDFGRVRDKDIVVVLLLVYNERREGM